LRARIAVASDAATPLPSPAPKARWRCALPEKRGSVGYGVALRRYSSSVSVEHGGSHLNRTADARLADLAAPLPGTCPGLTVYKV